MTIQRLIELLRSVIPFILVAMSLSERCFSSQDAISHDIGHVTLVIGKAMLIDKNGEVRSIKRDDVVQEGQTIETMNGGHVQIRFIDNGMISLRPNSKLSIESYQYDTSIPSNSAIRLKLENGVVRSISGKATEAAHDRFRLNTPITAIGVLGTDFVVRVEPEKMLAAVYSGAIAISPFNEQCEMSSFGACHGSTQLTDTMRGLMIEFNRQNNQYPIKPIDADLLSKNNSDDKNTKSTDASGTTLGRLNTTEINADQFMQQTEDNKSLHDQQPVITEVDPYVWGRWQAPRWPGDTMALPYAEARQNRSVVLGNKNYVLLTDQDKFSQLPSQAGNYIFQLTQSQVSFTPKWQENQISQAKLESGILQIDFANRQFNTDLKMNSPVAGSAELNISGAIANNGMFAAHQSDGMVAGAVSMQGMHAGMLFEKNVSSGMFQGISNWTRP